VAAGHRAADHRPLGACARGGVLNIIRRTPLFAHRMNLLRARGLLPHSGGSFRRGALVLATRTTASVDRRLSATVLPWSPGFLGNAPLILSHGLSRRAYVFCMASLLPRF
jgi:hypothetical protein